MSDVTRLINILLESNLDTETKSLLMQELGYQRGRRDAKRQQEADETTRHILRAP